MKNHALIVRQAIVRRDRHFQVFAQLRRIGGAVGQVDTVMHRHPRIDRVIGPAEFLQRRDIARGGAKLRECMSLARERQAVEQEQPGLLALLLFNGEPQQTFAPGLGQVHGQ